MCVELPLGCSVGGRHPCDGGCWKPKDKVLNVWRSTGNWPVLHITSLVSDTGNSVTVIGSVRGQGNHKRLHRSTVRETNVGTSDIRLQENSNSKFGQTAAAPKPLWKDFDQSAEQNTLEVQTLWDQQWEKIDFVSLNQLDTLENVAIGGVAQVVSHGVKVVGVHGEEGQEKDEEVRWRGKRRSRATQRETLIMDGMWMKVKDSRDDLSQCGCDTCVMKTRHLTACRRAQTSRMLCLCLSVYVVSLLSLSTLVLKVYLSSYTFA